MKLIENSEQRTSSNYSSRFNRFLDCLPDVPKVPLARVAWLAEMFETHRNTPRGWVLENKIPHKLDQIVAKLITLYGEPGMDAELWARWVKWDGTEPQQAPRPTGSPLEIDHDLKRDLYLKVDNLASSKGIHLEKLNKNKRWRLYDIIVMYTNAIGAGQVDEAFVEAVLELLEE